MRAALSHPIARLLDLGTAGYPARERRRLKILNAFSGLIIVSSAGYAASYALSDLWTYRWIIAINLVLVAVGICVPFAHRLGARTAGMLIIASECPALFGLVGLLGRESGIQLNLIVGAAAGFFIFGRNHLMLTGLTIALCLATHIAAWFLFPVGVVAVPHDFLVQLYVSSAVTTFALSAAIAHYAFTLAERAEAQTESLLHNILPGSIVDRLREHPERSIADTYPNVSILFSDIQGFVPLSHRLGAERTVGMLNDMMQRFDALAVRHGVEKIKTIGDAYMAVAGVPVPVSDHAARLARMAFAMLAAKDEVAADYGITIHIRIGVASGPVMAGVIGTQKFSYDVWGDAVNLAARLELSGEPDRIHVSAETRCQIGADCDAEPRGLVEIKGIGPVETWFLRSPNRDD